MYYIKKTKKIMIDTSKNERKGINYEKEKNSGCFDGRNNGNDCADW